MIRARPQSSAAYGGGHMVFEIYRAGDLHNKPGIFNVGRTHFYDVIEPRLLGPASAFAPSAVPIAASSASRPR